MRNRDFLADLGNLAMASRLRRLAERLYRDGERVYAAHDVDFEPRWFQVAARLKGADGAPLTITGMAADLGITHPAVIKVVREMEERGIVASVHDPADARQRRIRLTAKGERLLVRLEPLWDAFAEATRRLFEEIGCDVMAAVGRLEAALDEQDMARRIGCSYQDRGPAVTIVDHRPGLEEHFRRLNEEWLAADFRVEADDRRQLGEPKTEIIDRGGEILYALVRERVVGTVALVRLSSRRFELAKMAVAGTDRGKGIGDALLRAAVDRARQRGAAAIVLTTHRKQRAAMHLYRKHGFVERRVRIPGADRVERAADGVSMVLDLGRQAGFREDGGAS